MTRRLPLLALALFLVVAFAAPAGANLESELDEVREDMAEVRAQIESSSAGRSDLADTVLAAFDRLDLAERDVTATTARLERVARTVDERTKALDDTRDLLAEQFSELARTRELRDAAQNEARKWALDAYMSGGTAQPSIAFNATAISDVSVGVAYLDVLAASSSSAADRFSVLVDAEEAEEREILNLQASIQADIADLEALTAELGTLQQQLEGERTELQTAYEDQKALLDQMDTQVEEFEGELAALAREEASIRSAIAAASRSNVVSSGGFVRPVPGAISSGFGMRIHPITGQNRMHNGVDMNASLGQPIKAARSGVVILSGVKGGYGNTVMIDHGSGMVTLYAHQSRISVSVGERVDRGEVIGYAGSTGQSTGPHLHFEVRLHGTPVNPAHYL